MSIKSPIVSTGWKLVSQDGTPVVKGQACVTFRNEPCTVKGGTPPHKEGSTGRISTNRGEFFPSVCNLQWVAA